MRTQTNNSLESDACEFFDEEYRPCLTVTSREINKIQKVFYFFKRYYTPKERLPTYAEEVRRYYDGR